VPDKRLDRIAGRPIPPPVDESASDAAYTGTQEHPNRRSQTLYVTEPGLYLRVKGDVPDQRVATRPLSPATGASTARSQP
jgi:hypothetical protein